MRHSIGNLSQGMMALLLMATACEQSSQQATKTPVDQATFMERTRCGGNDDEKTVAPVLSGSAVTAVQPLYNNVEGVKSGPQAELRGATIKVAALPGITAEWLDRTLECHSAKATLGHTQTTPDDPFWLPGSSVDIDVRSAKDGFDINVAGFSPDDARQIVARANSFAKAKAAPSATAAPAAPAAPPASK